MTQLRKCITGLAFLLLAMALVFTVLAGVRSARQTISSAPELPCSYETRIETFKTARQQLRSLQKAQLNDVAHDQSNDAELQSMAQRQLLNLCTREEQELTLEGILQIRGYKNALVTIQHDSANVLIETDIITQQDSAMILELVCRETGIDSGNVKIIPIN